MAYKVTMEDQAIKDMIEDIRHPHMEDAWREVGEAAVEEVKTNFDVGGRPEAWPPKKDGYPSYLVATGTLKESVDYAITMDGVEVLPGEDYGVHHILGTKSLPIRDYMILPDEFIDASVEILTKALLGEDK